MAELLPRLSRSPFEKLSEIDNSPTSSSLFLSGLHSSRNFSGPAGYGTGASSTGSIHSSKAVEFPFSNENERPRTVSQSTIDLLRISANNAVASRKPSVRASRTSSWDNDTSSQKLSAGSALERETPHSEDVGVGKNTVYASKASSSHEKTVNGKNESSESLPVESNGSIRVKRPLQEQSLPDTSATSPTNNQEAPFKRWISTLRRKSEKHRNATAALDRSMKESLGINQQLYEAEEPASLHRKSSSHTSSGFVSAVKTASFTLASFSIRPPSKAAGVPNRKRSGTRSSRYSNSGIRLSTDSQTGLPSPGIDNAVWARALKRRQIIEELIASEEGYVTDLKTLVNVYFNLLASMPLVSSQIQHSIRQNLTEILRLHEEMLEELRRVIPGSEYLQDPNTRSNMTARPKHTRWHSMQALPHHDHETIDSRIARKSIDVVRPLENDMAALPTAEPQAAAEVARIFGRMMGRFFAYEEYSAQHEMMVQDVASVYKSLPTWQAYERGIEALANCVASINSTEANGAKSLTFSDLLIKPIQRVCKYPLLFVDLRFCTPVFDCPDSHAELDKTLSRLRETVDEINKAYRDPQTRDRMQKTWLLQERLVFSDPDQPSSSNSAATLRLLGHIQLCGVLHVTWQTHEEVQGQYMLCALFKSLLVMALPKKSEPSYQVVIAINVQDLKVRESDNGKGLQCPGALFTWKLMFEFDHHLYEIILSACSAKEEIEWRNRLQQRSIAEGETLSTDRPSPAQLLSSMALALKPIGPIFGQPGTLARRISIQRATTVGSKTTPCQVIIRNTHALKDGVDQFPPSVPIRSQSLIATAGNKLPILAPKRSERVRMEAALGDVWTSDTLPYPGMGIRKPERPLRASASSMMRKLSIVSLTTFTKRSMSHSSIPTTNMREDEGELPVRLSGSDGFSKEELDSLQVNGNSPIADSQSRVSSQPILPPPRTSSAKGFRRPKSAHWSSAFNANSAHSTIGELNEKADYAPRTSPKRKWSSRAGVVKSLSTDAIRKLFG